MNNEKYEKLLKNALGVAIFLLVLFIIMFIFNIANTTLNTINTISIISYILRILQIALLIATIVGIKKRALYGPLSGIIVSILMILSLDLISIIIGIFYLIDTIRIFKHMKNN
ncbi:MAG: hypothetical protein RSB67_02480 [Clostridia bacterium]